MNNKIFIALHTRNGALLDMLRDKLEDGDFFDRYGTAEMSARYGRFGFVTVAPDGERGQWSCFRRMLGCSYVYLPRGWQGDRCSRKAFIWAEILGKNVIFEEDERCR